MRTSYAVAWVSLEGLTEDKKHLCLVCKKTFKTGAGIQNHIKKYHVEEILTAEINFLHLN